MYIKNILFACFFLLSWAGALAQETMEMKIMSAVNPSETHYVIIASAVHGEANAMVTEIVELAKYGDSKTIVIPLSAEILVFAITSASEFEKLATFPAKYQDAAKRMSVEGMKSCNLVLGKNDEGELHYKLSNIQW